MQHCAVQIALFRRKSRYYLR